MANLNKVMLIGRLTRDPETRTFANGGKVAKFGFAVNYLLQKKNPTTGEWEGGETAFVDIEAFNRPSGGRQLADLVEQRLRKGNQVYLEGKLRLNEWTDKEGQKRSKLLVVLDSLEFLEARGEGGGGEGYRSQRPSGSSYGANAPSAASGPDEPESFDPPESGGGTENSDIPF
jgi:single-strand DNA-binding protein